MMHPDLSRITWRKSSRSSGGASNCVEVGIAADVIGVRDTKDRAGGYFEVSSAAWTAFLDRTKVGDFDL